MKAYDLAALEKGRAQAKEDIRAGQPRLYWGIRGEWGRYLTEMMRTRFGVEVEGTSCLTTDQETSFRQGYNAQIRHHVDSKFGSGSFDKALDDMNVFRKRLYDEWVRSKGLT